MNTAHELRRLADEIEKTKAKTDIPDGYEEIPAEECKGQEVEGLMFFSYALRNWAECRFATPGSRHIRPKKTEQTWTLGRELPGFRALRDGEEWHFADRWKSWMLPEGTRPLLLGEEEKPDDVAFFSDGTTSVIRGNGDITKPENMQIPRRTKRPLPLLTKSQVADGWKEWHGGENPVPRKRCERLFRDGGQGGIMDSNCYRWSHEGRNGDIIAYRVIEPKLIPLGPEDVPPGSVFRMNHFNPGIWVMPCATSSKGISYSSPDLECEEIDWSQLFHKWQINRSLSLGKWDPSAWQPCSKEVAV